MRYHTMRVAALIYCIARNRTESDQEPKNVEEKLKRKPTRTSNPRIREDSPRWVHQTSAVLHEIAGYTVIW